MSFTTKMKCDQLVDTSGSIAQQTAIQYISNLIKTLSRPTQSEQNGKSLRLQLFDKLNHFFVLVWPTVIALCNTATEQQINLN